MRFKEDAKVATLGLGEDANFSMDDGTPDGEEDVTESIYTDLWHDMLCIQYSIYIYIYIYIYIDQHLLRLGKTRI